MKYGIEYEFFVFNDKNEPVPAYLATSNLDGNPVIGELRTKIHDSIVDCIFELKKLIYLERSLLKLKNFSIHDQHFIKVSDEFLKKLRKDKTYVNTKELEVLEELSISSGKTGKMLPRGTYKASLQINFSENKVFNFFEYEKVIVEDKYKYAKSITAKMHSEVFDYVSILKKLDKAFAEEIKSTQRVSGVYAIKSGELGNRVEYRSLPNTISLDKLLEVL